MPYNDLTSVTSRTTTIESRLNATSYKQATAASGYAFSTQSANGFTLSGNTVTAYYSGSWSSGKSVTPTTTLATIDTSIRPNTVQYTLGYYSTGSQSTWTPCTFAIRADGTITVNITNTDLRFILLCGAYGI